MPVLKLNFEGELRRIQLQGKQEELSYEQIRREIAEGWPAVAAHVAKYTDDEGDLCTLSAASFQDFLEQSSGTLKLELMPAKAPKPMLSASDATESQPSQNAGSNWTAEMSEHCKQLTEHWSGQWKRRRWEEQQHRGDWSRHKGKKFHGCGGDERGLLLKGEKLMWVLSRLRATDALTAKTVAGLAVHMLPKIIAKMTEDMPEVDRKLKDVLPKVKQTLQDVCQLATSTPGLEHCVPAIQDALNEGSSSPGEAALALLLALESLPFDAKIGFAETLYSTQAHLVSDKLDKTDEITHHLFAWAEVPLVHEGITCDGCGQTPIKGLRFKCAERQDYDLCGECYAQKNTVQGGGCESHDFQCIVVDWRTFWKQQAGGGCGMKEAMAHNWAAIKEACGKSWGKGWGKGWDNSWGKGWGKSWADDAQEPRDDFPHEGKGWGKGKWKGKGMCSPLVNATAPVESSEPEQQAEKQTDSSIAETQASELNAPMEQEPEAPVPAATSPALQKFPVVFGDGRQLTIEWKCGEDPQQVALCFAAMHGIQADELPTIVAFVEHADSIIRKQSQGAGREAMPEEKVPSQEELGLAEQVSKMDIQDEDENVKTLVEMGFGPDSESLRELLRSSGNSLQTVIECLMK